jgi:hypothetical protein
VPLSHRQAWGESKAAFKRDVLEALVPDRSDAYRSRNTCKARSCNFTVSSKAFSKDAGVFLYFATSPSRRSRTVH